MNTKVISAFIERNSNINEDLSTGSLISLGNLVRDIVEIAGYEVSDTTGVSAIMCQGHSFLTQVLADLIGIKGEIIEFGQKGYTLHVAFAIANKERGCYKILDAYPEGMFGQPEVAVYELPENSPDIHPTQQDKSWYQQYQVLALAYRNVLQNNPYCKAAFAKFLLENKMTLNRG